MTESAPPPRRGRPPVDAQQIQRIALRLFSQHGYAATSIDDIVRELGIGRTTFFRHYPSKSSVMWREHEESSRRLTAELHALDPGMGLSGVARAIVLSQSGQAPDRALVRARDILIGSEPELYRESATMTAGWAGQVATHLRERGWAQTHPSAPDAIAFAFLGAAAAGLRMWSESETADLVDVLASALDPVTTAMQVAFERS